MDPQAESLKNEHIWEEDPTHFEDTDEYDDALLRSKWEPMPRADYIPDMDGGLGQFERENYYSDRGPKDFIISGPMLGGWGPGRWFPTRGLAFNWALEKYGRERLQYTKQTQGRWAFLVRGV